LNTLAPARPSAFLAVCFVSPVSKSVSVLFFPLTDDLSSFPVFALYVRFCLWRLRLLLYPEDFRMNITGGFTPAYYCSLNPPVSASFRKSNMTRLHRRFTFVHLISIPPCPLSG
jgi:hypothetical protein